MKDSKEKKVDMNDVYICTYIAMCNTPFTSAFVRENGISAYPGTGIVPLALDPEAAIEELQMECERTETESTKTILLFCIEVPTNEDMVSISTPDLPYQYLGFKGHLPQEYISDIYVLGPTEE